MLNIDNDFAGQIDFWIVEWFPDDKPVDTKVFKDEGRARRFAESRSVDGEAPILSHQRIHVPGFKTVENYALSPNDQGKF